MANMDTSHNDAIFNEKDVKELSENLSRVFCKFVNTKIGDNNMLKKYIDNYKALLHLPIFSEMHTEIERLKEQLEVLNNEEHIKLEVEETREYDVPPTGPPAVVFSRWGECPIAPTGPPSDDEEVEVTDQEEVVTDDGEDVPYDGETGEYGVPPTGTPSDEEEVEEEEKEVEEEVTDDEEEEVEVTDDEEEVEEEEVEVTDEEEVEVTDDEEEEVEETDEEVEEEGGKGGHLPPEEEGGKGGHLPPEEEGGKGGHLPPEEEEEMYEWEDEESGNTYYTNDPDGESGDIYECLEDEEIGEHIGTITNGKISLF